MTFDGSDDCLHYDVGSPAALTDGSGQWTAFAAVKFNSVAGTQSIVDGDFPSARVAQFLRLNGGVLESIAFTSGGTPIFATGTTSISTGVWYNVVVVCTTTTLKIYLNGTLEATATVSSALQTAANPLGFGANNAASSPTRFAERSDVLRRPSYRAVLCSRNRQSQHLPSEYARMMKRILLALALLVGLAAPAYATEINTDTGCDSSGAWMLGTGWTVTGSKCVGTSVSKMKMLMQMTTKVKAGHRYKLTFTLSSYTAGSVRGFVGVTMPTAPVGSYVTAASVSDIADNFTTANGLTSAGLTALADTANPAAGSGTLGAFRFVCTHANYGWIDPLVYPGLASPHLHDFYGNTRVGKSWGFSDFRTKGSSTCGDQADPKSPLNRSGYWIPAMLKSTSKGLFAIKPSMIQIYYKGPSNTAADPACAAASPTNDCPNIPTGLRMTFGYKSSTGTGGRWTSPAPRLTART
jgi:hypothetical protein